MRDNQPEVTLIDARDAGLDERGLRQRARAIAAQTGLPHSSRSYRFPLALIAAHHGPVGVDIERIEAPDPGFLESICTPGERGRSPEASSSEAYVSSLWASKEALAKALGEPLRYDPRRLDSPMFWPAGASGPWRAVALAAPEGHTAWLCWLADHARSD